MKVVIIGGGFAGLKLTRMLDNKPGFDVLLLDRFNYHQFQPLFYQVATAGLDASNISFPLRKVLHHSKNCRFRIADISSIDTGNKKVITDVGTFAYDVLVIATGADTNYFGNQQLIDNTFPMKSTPEALRIRHRLIQNFEDALVATDPAAYNRLLTIIIVGGGPTGVELSGAIADMRKFVLPKDYPEIDFSKMKIYLLEGSPKTLGTMGDKSAADSLRYLEEMNVIVKTNTVLKSYDGKTATTAAGETIESSMVIWAAGIKGNVPGGIDPSLVVRGNRIKVDPYNKVLGLTDVYAVGDIAAMATALYPNGHPQLAAVAIDQAKLLAHNLINIQQNRARDVKPFEYHDKGVMATIGRNKAVVDLPKPKLHFKGFFAWLIWMGLHLFLILGVKNRISVFANWIYNYVTYDQNLRLIFKEFYKPKEQTRS